MTVGTVSGNKRSLPTLETLADKQVSKNLFTAKQNRQKAWPNSKPYQVSPHAPLKKSMQELLKKLPDVGTRHKIIPKIHNALMMDADFSSRDRKHVLDTVRKFPPLKEPLRKLLENLPNNYDDPDSDEKFDQQDDTVREIFHTLSTDQDLTEEHKKYVMNALENFNTNELCDVVAGAYSYRHTWMNPQININSPNNVVHYLNFMCDPVVTSADPDGAFVKSLEFLFHPSGWDCTYNFYNDRDIETFKNIVEYVINKPCQNVINYWKRTGYLQVKLAEISHSEAYQSQDRYKNTKSYVRTFENGDGIMMVWAEPQREEVPVMSIEQIHTNNHNNPNWYQAY